MIVHDSPQAIHGRRAPQKKTLFTRYLKIVQVRKCVKNIWKFKKNDFINKNYASGVMIEGQWDPERQRNKSKYSQVISS